MIDDLLKQIEEVIGEEGDNQDKKDPRGNVVVGNQSTVVIGDGNHHIGRRESDQQEEGGGNSSCYGRRESDHAIRDELKQLRSQVKDLAQLITRLFLKNGSEGFKDDLPDTSGCLNSNDRTPSKRAGVSFCSRIAESPLVKPKSRAMPCSIPDHFCSSHFIPDVSKLMAAHNVCVRFIMC